MLRALVDFALKNRWLVLGGVIVLTAWGVVSFRNLPIEAYPDVANNYVQIITQWPGRSAEEIERQVTVPVEIQMAGIPHLTHLRSTTLAGLSSLMLIFDDDSTSDVNREHVLERLSQVNLPGGSGSADGHGLEPGGPDLLVHAGEHQSRLRRDGEEVARRLAAGKVVQGRYRRGRCFELRRSDQGVPDQARSGQAGCLRAVASARSSSRSPTTTPTAAAAFIEEGAQQINVQSLGLYTSVQDIENTVVKTRNGAAIRVKDIATVFTGPKIRLGQIGRADSSLRRHDCG